MAFILYNLEKYDDAKMYYNKALQVDSNLTKILTDRELMAFKTLIGTSQQSIGILSNTFINRTVGCIGKLMKKLWWIIDNSKIEVK